MRLLYVVQRYGAEVFGGAEAHCREFATRMAGRGHEVEVLTTCARRYSDWANEYPEGTSDDGGVLVHRLPVARPREAAVFDHLTTRVMAAPRIDISLEREWVRLQGPYVPGLVPWIDRRAAGYDAVVFVTYLYFTTWAGLPPAAEHAPALLHPTAHDEPYLALRTYDPVFRSAGALAFLTPEEEALVHRRFGGLAPGAVVGVGVDLDVTGDADRFRARHGLGDRPYLLYVGRYDVGKASEEMARWFLAVKERTPGPLALVVMGEPVREPPEHDDLVVTGFVDEGTKHDALAGATALVQPSYLESFSMVLGEAWAHRRPVLAQAASAAVAGRVRRSGGGLLYSGFAEFEAAIEMLADDPELAGALGDRGRRHVETHDRWDAVLDRYDHLLRSATSVTPTAASPRRS